MHLRALFYTPFTILLAALFHRLLEHESSQIMLQQTFDHFFLYKSVTKIVGEQASRDQQAG
jgi:hypothetical protein